MSLQDNISEKISTSSTDHFEIKGYLEDDEALWYLKKILNMAYDFKTFTVKGKKIRLHLIALGIGGSNLLNLSIKEPYFKKTLAIIDGDTSIQTKHKNAIKLPTPLKEKCNPETTIYEYIKGIADGKEARYKESAKKLIEINRATNTVLREKILSLGNISNRDTAKSWIKKAKSSIEQYEIFTYFQKDFKQQLDTFKNQLENKLHELVCK